VSYVPTAASDIIKKPQFVEELVDGTLPLASPSFKTCGFIDSIGEDIAIENNQIRPVGSYDIKRVVKMGEDIGSSLEFQPVDFRVMKYGMLLPISPTTTPGDPTMVAPNGTVGVSVSLLLSALINGVEKYKVYKGVRFDGVSGDISRDGGFKVSMPFKARDVTDWTATPTFVTPTFATDPGTDPWSGITSGADPLDIGGVKYDTTSFKFDINFGIARPKFNGQTSFKLSKAVTRTMQVTFNTVTIGGALVGDMRGFTPRDVEYTVVSGGGSKIKFNQCKFISYSKPVSGDSEDIWMEEFTAIPENGVTITGT
jgi:hypothetical protein